MKADLEEGIHSILFLCPFPVFRTRPNKIVGKAVEFKANIPSLCWNPIWAKIWEKDNLFFFNPWSLSHLEEEMRGCTSKSHGIASFLFSFWLATCRLEFLKYFLCFSPQVTSVNRKYWKLSHSLPSQNISSSSHIFFNIFYWKSVTHSFKTLCWNMWLSAKINHFDTYRYEPLHLSLSSWKFFCLHQMGLHLELENFSVHHMYITHLLHTLSAAGNFLKKFRLPFSHLAPAPKHVGWDTELGFIQGELFSCPYHPIGAFLNSAFR